MPSYTVIPPYFDAPAKINLALHVVGQRDDGYHLIDSLVTFAEIGDTLHFKTGDKLELTVTGPEANTVPTDNSNLILKAARALIDLTGWSGTGMTIHLEKHLPVASGIGGGSANAASTLNALNAHWRLGLDEDTLCAVGLTLGADVPMCLRGGGLRIQGVGEIITPIGLPGCPVVLINPRVEVSTVSVFNALENKMNQPLTNVWEENRAPDDWITRLHNMRNDLETPALKIAPVIGDCLAALRTDPTCLIARMSGSGATCFGLFEDKQDADAAAKQIRTDHPEWWVVSTRTMG